MTHGPTSRHCSFTVLVADKEHRQSSSEGRCPPRPLTGTAPPCMCLHVSHVPQPAPWTVKHTTQHTHCPALHVPVLTSCARRRPCMCRASGQALRFFFGGGWGPFGAIAFSLTAMNLHVPECHRASQCFRPCFRCSSTVHGAGEEYTSVSERLARTLVPLNNFSQACSHGGGKAAFCQPMGALTSFSIHRSRPYRDTSPWRLRADRGCRFFQKSLRSLRSQ